MKNESENTKSNIHKLKGVAGQRLDIGPKCWDIFFAFVDVPWPIKIPELIAAIAGLKSRSLSEIGYEKIV